MRIEEFFKTLTLVKALGISIVLGGLVYLSVENADSIKMQISNLTNEQNQKRDKIKQYEQSIENYEKFKATFAEKNKIYVDALTFMTTEVNSADVMHILSNSIQSSGGNEAVIQPKGSGKNAQGLEEYPFSIRFRGDFNSIVTFMSEITKFKFVTNFREIKISMGSFDSQDGKLSFSGELIIFKYLPVSDISTQKTGTGAK